MRLSLLTRLAPVVVLLLPASHQAFGWGREGHMMISRIAVEKLPADVPAFLRSKKAADQIEYQGPEPDRWRSYATEPELEAVQAPEHFIDLEWADLVSKPLPRKRYDFIRALDATQKQHPELTFTPEKIGLQPYVTTEVWERLKSAMRDYRALEKKHQSTEAVEALIIYYAGWLGHYVADGSQPMHVSLQYNGWTGPNPNGYSTSHDIHWKFEGIYVKANVKAADIAPLVPEKPLPHGDILNDSIVRCSFLAFP